MTEKIDFENPILVPFAATSIHKIQYIFSFEYVDFWPKIFLILYPSLGILTTQITIVCHGQYFKCKTPEGGYYRNLEKKMRRGELNEYSFLQSPSDLELQFMGGCLLLFIIVVVYWLKLLAQNCYLWFET